MSRTHLHCFRLPALYHEANISLGQGLIPSSHPNMMTAQLMSIIYILFSFVVYTQLLTFLTLDLKNEVEHLVW